MNTVKKNFFALSILFAFFFYASAAECIIPQPFRIGGTVTVDGSQLNQTSDSGYTFVVTRQNGNDFNPKASDTDGLNGSSLYIIDIPMYEANDQPGGGNPGEVAVIHVYKNGEDLVVTSPADGFITIGNVGSTQRIDLIVTSPYTPTQYQLTTLVSEGNGSVFPASGTYDEGTVVTLTATPNAGYRVASWSGTNDNGSTSNTNTVTMNSDKTVTVAFEEIPPPQYTLNSLVSGGNGSVFPASGTYDEGTVVTLTATPNTGYRVASWSGTNSDGSTSDTNTVTMNSNKTVTITFEEIPPPQYTLSASVLGGNGSISPTSGTHDEGTVVTLIATPNAGYYVASWTGTNNNGSTSNINTVTMNSDKTVTVTFNELPPVIEGFTASPNTITGGESTTLSWNITGADGANINNGIGSVDASGGSISVSPDTTTIYTLTVTNSGGSVSASLSVTVEEYVPPQSPIADAGPNQVADEGTTVTLNGLNSTDPDGTIVSYSWEQTAGELVDLSDSWTPEISFTSPDVDMDGESLSFQLTVMDNDGLETQDECIVNVVWVNEPPSADAGPDQSVYSGDEVVLDATMSSDVDDGIATYSWEQIEGPSVALSGENSVQATFLAPDVGDGGEALTFVLTVTDNGNLMITDTCVVNVESWINSPPIADAGPDQEVNEQDTVTLDGSGSVDWDDGIHSYLWTQTAGTPVVLSNTLVERPTFYAPEVEIDGAVLIFELTVTDQGGLKSTDSCSIWINQNPTEPTLAVIWVDSLTVSLERKGANYKAQASVTVLDENLDPVKGATVTVTWTYNGTNPYTASGVTKKKGVATLSSSPVKAKSGDVFTVEVIGVAIEGYTYDPSSNMATMDSIIVP